MSDERQQQPVVRHRPDRVDAASESVPPEKPNTALRPNACGGGAQRALNAGFVRATPAAWVAWTLAAMLALAGAWFGQLYLSTRAENALRVDQQRLAELELRSAAQHAEAERLLDRQQLKEAAQQIAHFRGRSAELDAELAATQQQLTEVKHRLFAALADVAEAHAQLASAGPAMAESPAKTEDVAALDISMLSDQGATAPQPRGAVVWNSVTHEGLLRVANLPALSADQEYHLWLIGDGAPSPVPAGVFTVDQGSTSQRQIPFRADAPGSDRPKVVISVERRGGTPSAPGTIILSAD